MKRMISATLVLALSLFLISCSSSNPSGTASSLSSENLSATAGEIVTGNYSVYVQGDDWGAGTSKIFLTFDQPLDALSKEDLEVSETKEATDFVTSGYPVEVVTNDRNILSAYLVGASGEKTTEPSKNAVIELEISPDVGSPFLYSMDTGYNTWSDPYTLTIEKKSSATLNTGDKEVEALNIAPEIAKRTTSADMFTMDTFKAADGVTYEYASFVPETPSDQLVVWLHGAGEGGLENTDPSIPLLANKAGKLGDSDFQSTVGGAYILVPQCPTYWMDSDGSGNKNGELTSFYTESLEELIATYKEEHGISKVILAGCSNGGYMAMVLALNNPTGYEAIVPVCEALKDEYIPDEKLATIKDLPMYFIYSEDDTTVDPALYEEPTIVRLRALGASQLEVSTTDHVTDLSERFTDENGDPHQYNGHFSWVYFFNNEAVSEDGTTSWDWIAKQFNS